MKDIYYLYGYLAVGAIGTLLVMWRIYRNERCPTRGEAITEFVLGTAFGPVAVILVILVSPIWVPIVLYNDYYKDSKLDTAITAWFNKPICK